MSRHHSAEFKTAVCEMKGKLTAQQIGDKFGLTRKAVIGIWWRGGTLPVRNGKSIISKQAKIDRLHRHYAQLGRKGYDGVDT